MDTQEQRVGQAQVEVLTTLFAFGLPPAVLVVMFVYQVSSSGSVALRASCATIHRCSC